MSNAPQDLLREISALLHDAYSHFWEHGDGHHKSGEGHISLDFGNVWDRMDQEGGPMPPYVTGVSIYSYVLGPSRDRDHYFDSLEQALAMVRQWHANELASCGGCTWKSLLEGSKS